jgi:hypothetical protein
MDIGRSFTFVTEDEEWWQKVLIGGLLSLIPVVGPLYLMGYALQVTKNVISGQEVPLPEALDDFGGKIVKGLMLSIIVLVYMLPLIIVSACAGGGGAFFAENIADRAARDIVPVVWSSCFGCLSMLYGIFIGLLMPFVWGTYAETERFGDAFQVGKILQMLRLNIGPAFIVFIVSGLAGMLALLVGLVLCVIGLVFTSFYAQLVTGFLYGSLHKEAKTAVL